MQYLLTWTFYLTFKMITGGTDLTPNASPQVRLGDNQEGYGPGLPFVSDRN